MKISRLLELHDASQTAESVDSKNAEGLALNFGDAFLVQNNSIYRAVRRATLREGFEYTTNVTNAFLALPLSQLDQILQTQKIPYSDNVTVLREVEKKIPNATVWDQVSDGLKRNYVFHESCHCISRTEIQAIFGTGAGTVEERVTRLLLEESFSNTCELLAIVDAERTAHRIFFEANSYIFMFEDRVLMKELIHQLGLNDFFQIVILFYLHSNFLYGQLDDRPLERVLKLLTSDRRQFIKSNAAVLKKLRAVAKIAFQLNPRFREVTTGFYLRLSGLKISTEQIHQIDFMKWVEDDSRYLETIRQLRKKIEDPDGDLGPH